MDPRKGQEKRSGGRREAGQSKTSSPRIPPPHGPAVGDPVGREDTRGHRPGPRVPGEPRREHRERPMTRVASLRRERSDEGRGDGDELTPPSPYHMTSEIRAHGDAIL